MLGIKSGTDTNHEYFEEACVAEEFIVLMFIPDM